MTCRTQAAPYECPCCGSSSTTQYFNCHRPQCPDGRDQSHLRLVAATEEPLPAGWDAVAAHYERRIRWLKWTLLFPCVLLLVIALGLLLAPKARAADAKSIPYYCHALYGMPYNCDSVKKYVNRYGKYLAFRMAKVCGALQADLDEAARCLNPGAGAR